MDSSVSPHRMTPANLLVAGEMISVASLQVRPGGGGNSNKKICFQLPPPPPGHTGFDFIMPLPDFANCGKFAVSLYIIICDNMIDYRLIIYSWCCSQYNIYSWCYSRYRIVFTVSVYSHHYLGGKRPRGLNEISRRHTENGIFFSITPRGVLVTKI